MGGLKFPKIEASYLLTAVLKPYPREQVKAYFTKQFQSQPRWQMPWLLSMETLLANYLPGFEKKLKALVAAADGADQYQEVQKDEVSDYTTWSVVRLVLYVTLFLSLLGVALSALSTILIDSDMVIFRKEPWRAYLFSLIPVGLSIAGFEALSGSFTTSAGRRRYETAVTMAAILGGLYWCAEFPEVFGGGLGNPTPQGPGSLGVEVVVDDKLANAKRFLTVGLVGEALLAASSWFRITAICRSHQVWGQVKTDAARTLDRETKSAEKNKRRVVHTLGILKTHIGRHSNQCNTYVSEAMAIYDYGIEGKHNAALLTEKLPQMVREANERLRKSAPDTNGRFYQDFDDRKED